MRVFLVVRTDASRSLKYWTGRLQRNGRAQSTRDRRQAARYDDPAGAYAAAAAAPGLADWRVIGYSAVTFHVTQGGSDERTTA